MNPTEIQTQNAPLYPPAGGVGTVDGAFTYTGQGSQGGWEQTNSNIASTSAMNSNAARNEINGIVQDVNNTETQQSNIQAPTQTDSRQGVNDSLVGLLSEQENAYNDFVGAIDKWSGNAIKFSREEQKMLDDIKERYKGITNRQIVANQGLEGSFAASQGASGIARYGSELAAIETQQIVQQGIDRLREIDLSAEEELRKTRESIIQGHIDGIKESYQAYNDRIKDRRDTLSQLRLNLSDIEDYAIQQERLALEKRRVAVDEGRLSFDIAKYKKSTTLNFSSVDLPEEFAGMSTEDVQSDLKKNKAPDWFTKMFIIQLANEGFTGDSEISAGGQLVDTTKFVDRKAQRVLNGKSISDIKLSQKRLQTAWDNFKATPEMKRYTAPTTSGSFLSEYTTSSSDYNAY